MIITAPSFPTSKLNNHSPRVYEISNFGIPFFSHNNYILNFVRMVSSSRDKEFVGN